MEGIEKASLTWRTLMDWVDAEIAEMHTVNENPQLTPDETLALRTRLATLREIAALTEPAKAPAPEPVPFDAR